MKTLVKKQIIVLIASLAFFLVVAAGIAVLFRLIEARAAVVQDIKEQIATYQVNKRAFSEEAQQIKLLQSRFSVLSDYVVTEKNLPTILSTIETLAKENALSLDITEVATPVKDATTSLIVEFTAQGNYTALQSFLASLLHQPYAASFSRIEFVANTTPEQTPVSGKKPLVKQLPQEQQWRVFGTLTVLSF